MSLAGVAAKMAYMIPTKQGHRRQYGLPTLARPGDGLKFQMTAAHRADGAFGKNSHPGTLFSRHRTARGRHGDQNGGLIGKPGKKCFGRCHKNLPIKLKHRPLMV